MLQETGKVVAVDDDGLWLETLKTSVCGQCAAKAGCGQQLLAKASASNMTFIKALFSEGHKGLLHSESGKDWHVGDMAVIEIDENVLVKATLLAYLLPLVTMLLVAGFFDFIYGGDVVVACAAVVGLLLGGCVVHWLARSRSNQHDFHACVVKRL